VSEDGALVVIGAPREDVGAWQRGVGGGRKGDGTNDVGRSTSGFQVVALNASSLAVTAETVWACDLFEPAYSYFSCLLA
jgi:hypothetical protein